MTIGALEVVRALYDAWNAGSVARAAGLLAPDVRWENFGEARPVEGLEGMHMTLAGPATGGTMMISPVVVDLLVGVGSHVVSEVRRSDPTGERERLEVWTVADGRVTRYRGYPVQEGLEVLTESTGSTRLAIVCRDVAAFNRGAAAGWPATLSSGPIGEIEVLADTPDGLLISAGATPQVLIAFAGDAVARVDAPGRI